MRFGVVESYVDSDDYGFTRKVFYTDKDIASGFSQDEWVQLYSDQFDESVPEHYELLDGSVFAEMNFILCRNVFIYFEKMLQNKVLALFDQSLCRNGFLCLGSSESLTFSDVEKDFTEIAGNEKIYQKKTKKAIKI
jgi:hypothetical protein